MNNELEIIAGFLERAQCPEDVFGNLAGTPKQQEEALKHAHRKLAKALHPDLFSDPSIRESAITAFQALEETLAIAKERLKRGEYGDHLPLPGKEPIIIKDKYVRSSFLVAGDIADLHMGYLESARTRNTLVIKVARKADDNDLLKAERDVLALIRPSLPEGSWRDAVPKVVDSFMLDEGNRMKRRVNVITALNGFYSGDVIHQRLPNGVDGRTLVWMWKRLIVLLEWVYKLGYIHGAVLPAHVMFYPDNDGNTKRDVRKHSIRLVDWCYAVDHKKRTRLSAWVPAYRDFYPFEIINKKPLGVNTDLYMGAKTMIHLAGGDVKLNTFPGHIPKEIANGILPCIEPDPAKRPQSIGKYFEGFDKLLREVFGAPKYHDFNLPGAVPRKTNAA